MPRAQFTNPTNGESITRAFPTPKRIESHDHWLKEIRKVIPQVPDVRNTDWSIFRFEPTDDGKWIAIELLNTIQERVYITVDRKFSSLAA